MSLDVIRCSYCGEETYHPANSCPRCGQRKAYVLGHMGNYGEAFKTLDKATEIDPKNEDAWYEKGRALNESGKYEEAIKAFDKAIEVSQYGNKGWYWYFKGTALRALGRTAESNVAFTRAKELGVTGPKSHEFTFVLSKPG